MEEKYVAALDVGTSTITCHIYNTRAEQIGKATDATKLHFPKPGYVEIVPDELWTTIQGVLKNAIKDAKISAGQVSSLGLSTQRGTFVTWDRRSGEYFHNFITWRDLRADKIVNEWNRSILNRAISVFAYILYTVSKSKRFLAASVMKFSSIQVTPRLYWAEKNIPKLKHAIRNGTAVFGTVDTWLLHKLTGGKICVTDYSNACATGLFDPFVQQWSFARMKLLGLPMGILPVVVDSAGDFSHVEESLLGAKIPITCCMADQSASLFGACCFNPGDVKLTMGTGSFININTGSNAHASILGLYPLVAWKYGNELSYMVEGNCTDTGTLLLWAQSAGLIKHAKETAEMANGVEDTDGVFFIPAFTGLGPPINDKTAAAGFIGVKMTTKREHLVRSILEAIVFGAVQLYKCTTIETSYKLHTIRVDGGVAQNDFVSQLISDITGLRVVRPVSSEISVLGCAFLSGLASGVWKSKEEIGALYKVDRVFTPRESIANSYEGTMTRWRDAVERFMGWYGKKCTNVSPNLSSVSTEFETQDQILYYLLYIPKLFIRNPKLIFVHLFTVLFVYFFFFNRVVKK